MAQHPLAWRSATRSWASSISCSCERARSALARAASPGVAPSAIPSRMARVGALLTRATPPRLAQTPGARAGSRPEAVARRGACQEVQGGRGVARESHRVLQLLCRRALLGRRRLCAEAPATGRSGARYEQRSLQRGGVRHEQRSLANKCEANGPETRSVQSRDIIEPAGPRGVYTRYVDLLSVSYQLFHKGSSREGWASRV